MSDIGDMKKNLLLAILSLTFCAFLAERETNYIGGLYEIQASNKSLDFVEFLTALGVNSSYFPMMKAQKKIHIEQTGTNKIKYKIIWPNYVKEGEFESGVPVNQTYIDGRLFTSVYKIDGNLVIHDFKFIDGTFAQASYYFTEDGFIITYACKGKIATRYFKRVGELQSK